MEDKVILERLKELSTNFTDPTSPVAIILAAGQGKRIKSNNSKMLHKIWGVPTVVRVAQSASLGLESPNQIVVVGIKAIEVASALGRAEGRRFALQAEQKGTGHAVQVALEKAGLSNAHRDYYVLPGDMGLITAETIASLKKAFKQSQAQMMVMVGNFQGDPSQNYYGRIVRVPEKDSAGLSSGDDCGKIIQIIEHRDILALPPDKPYLLQYRGRTYAFSRQQLLENREYNSGLYAFQGEHLFKLISQLGYNNVQGEMYLTDLIYLFNQAGLTVLGYQVLQEEELLGFNDKYVLNQMEQIARQKVYSKLGSIVHIVDSHNFFIAEDVIAHLLELDRQGLARDIVIREGAQLGQGVRLNEGVQIGRAAKLEGNIYLGKGVFIGDAVQISCYPQQRIIIGENTVILKDDVLKGNITIGKHCQIESSVRLTGSDEDPLIIGDHVQIKGDTYIYGSKIDAHCQIINCILHRVQIICQRDARGLVIPVGYIFPPPQGKECVKPLPPH